MVMDEAAAEMVGVGGGDGKSMAVVASQGLQSFEKRYLSSLVRGKKREEKKHQRMLNF
jgi:hypothetical protein